MSDGEKKWTKPKDDFRKYSDVQALKRELVATGRARNLTEAGKLVWKVIPRESKYQGNILKALKEEFPQGRWRKNAAGIGQDDGEPDLIGCLEGLYVAIEVKRPLVGVESELQKKAVRDILGAGGLAMFACYPEEVIPVVREWYERWGVAYLGHCDHETFLKPGTMDIYTAIMNKYTETEGGRDEEEKP